MIPIIIYYLVLPFVLAAAVLRLIKKYGDSRIPQDIEMLLDVRPIEKKFFRSWRRDLEGLAVIGDYETHGEAVEAAYLGRNHAKAAGHKAAFLITNDKGEVLEEVDS